MQLMEDKQDKNVSVDVYEVNKMLSGGCITTERNFYCCAVQETLYVAQYTEVTHITCY